MPYPFSLLLLLRILAQVSIALPIMALAILIAPASIRAEEPSENLLTNGDFEAGTESKANGWPDSDGASIQQEAGNRFLRFEGRPDAMLTLYRVVPIQQDHRALAFSFRVRVNNLKPGSENWHDGRIVLDFKDDSGNKISGGPGHPNFKGNSGGWVEKRLEFLVPASATKLEVMPAMFRVASGSIDLDDLKLIPVDPKPILQKQQAAAAKKAEEVARRAALVKPQVAPVSPDQLPPMLRVSGNQIVTEQGETVWLQGVAIPSMEWSASGENILQSVEEAIDNWNVNVIRLPVREHFWAGSGPWQNDGGAFYRQLVDDVINLAAAQGAYVVIDLHRFGAPQQVHAEFWQEVAEKYKNHPAVLFELFNEPHGIPWSVWHSGGSVSEQKQPTDVLTENNEKRTGTDSVGMQTLIDAVRNTGAQNIVIVGGLDWAYDLSGVLRGYALEDRDGRGIVYSTHVYPWKSDWRGKFMEVAETYPIFIGECGAPPKRLDFIPPERHEAPATWVPDFLGLVQEHKYHWTAWSFHPKAAPMLLQDWTYGPTPYWGIPARDALQGKQFEMTGMR